MKILQCRIENFGKLSNSVFDFADGANIFHEENGWGKSTLAAFIRIMLFGFENANKQDKLINERKRYLPWQGGVYGGSITFEVAGVSYIMRRVFGKKEKDDEFELREFDTNLPSDAYTTRIGEELFQIDGASFRRTVFISQQDCETSSTDGINAKLGNLVENTDDMNNFQTVYDTLKDHTNKMTPKRKTGSLNKEKTIIADMENTLREEGTIIQSMQRVEQMQEEQLEAKKALEEEIDIWQKKQTELSESLDVDAKKKEYQKQKEACTQAKEGLERCRAVFPDPAHIPSVEQVEEWHRWERKCEEHREGMLKNQLSDEERKAYEGLKQLLRNQIPTEEDMETMEEAGRECDKLRLELLSEGLTPTEEKEWEMLTERYPEGVPETTAIQRVRDMWSESQRRQEGLTGKKATVATLERVSEPRKSPSYISLLLSGLLGIVVSAAVGYLVHVLLGVLICVIFLGTLFIIGRRSGSRDKDEGTDSLVQLRKEITDDENRIEQVREDVKEFLLLYHISYQEETIPSDLAMLAADAMTYQTLFNRKQTQVGEEKKKRYETLRQTLSDFMKLYYEEVIPEERWASQLSVMKEQIRNFHRWQPKVTAYEEAELTFQKEYQKLVKEIQQYGFTITASLRMLLQGIRDNVNQYILAKSAYDKAMDEIAVFEQKNDMDRIRKAPELVDEDSLSEINDRLVVCREKRDSVTELISSYDKQLQEYQEKLDELLVQKVELAERREKYQEGLKKYELLLKTMNYLQKAKDSLTARYMGPVQRGFEKYYHMISGQEAVAYRFDASANLTVNEMGMSRETRFLSDGCKDLAGICTRMALVDAMYEDEKPFVVLDDPFVNLDDAKTEKALGFLQEISKEYQVIYFTCNGSRCGEKDHNSYQTFPPQVC